MSDPRQPPPESGSTPNGTPHSTPGNEPGDEPGSTSGSGHRSQRAGELPGARVLWTSWATTGLFAATAVADRAGVDALETPAAAVALACFVAGVIVWALAFARAVGRSRYDEIDLVGLFFLQGTAPRPVQVHLLGSFAVALVVAGATAVDAPFGVLEPVLPLALAGWWGARYGEFPERRR